MAYKIQGGYNRDARSGIMTDLNMNSKPGKVSDILENIKREIGTKTVLVFNQQFVNERILFK